MVAGDQLCTRWLLISHGQNYSYKLVVVPLQQFHLQRIPVSCLQSMTSATWHQRLTFSRAAEGCCRHTCHSVHSAWHRGNFAAGTKRLEGCRELLLLVWKSIYLSWPWIITWKDVNTFLWIATRYFHKNCTMVSWDTCLILVVTELVSQILSRLSIGVDRERERYKSRIKIKYVKIINNIGKKSANLRMQNREYAGVDCNLLNAHIFLV